MCILFIALNQHPQYPLVIAANRDEFHQRETQSMHWWPDKKILAGKDLQANGTWLGLTKAGKFSALTNYRQLPLKEGDFRSRGELPLKALLSSNETMADYLKLHFSNYQGFNLLYGDYQALVCFDSILGKFTQLTSGFHSLCNGSLDDVWPKMAKGEKALEQYIHTHKRINHQDLLSLLQDTEQAPESLLPDTGIGKDWEKMLSSIKIQSPEYGTRSSCVITQDLSGKFEVLEATYRADGTISKQHTFSWDAA